MARCKKCLHYEVCAKEGRMVQVDEHTWDEYNKLDDVEQFCTNYYTADVVPKSEVERLLDDFQRSIRADAKVGMSAGEILLHINNMLIELKKKYTKEKQ